MTRENDDKEKYSKLLAEIPDGEERKAMEEFLKNVENSFEKILEILSNSPSK